MKIKRGSHWRKIKQERLELDQNSCSYCGSKRNLICHHLTYKNNGEEKIEDIITLCKKCHLQAHKKVIYSWESKKVLYLINDFLEIESLLLQQMNFPDKIDIFHNENENLIRLRPNKQGRFNLIPSSKKNFKVVRDKYFSKFIYQCVKYSEVKFFPRDKSFEFKLIPRF